MSGSIYYEQGGSGPRTILLLHGLGATGAVWHALRATLQAGALGRWIAPDLSGHGSSPWRRTYSAGELAADIAPLVREEPQLYVLGHSLGVYVGLALASQWFGARVRAVLGIGPKVLWSEAEVQSMRELAARPVRWYDDQEQATARYRKLSGLDSRMAPGPEMLARGIVQAEQGYRLAQDPRSFMVGGGSFASLVASAPVPVLLARGEHDPMVTLEQLQAYRGDARDLAGAGHNVHVELPEAVVELLRESFAHA